MIMLRSIYKERCRTDLIQSLVALLIFILSDFIGIKILGSDKSSNIDIVVVLIWVTTIYMFFLKRKAMAIIVLALTMLNVLLYLQIEAYSEFCYFLTKQHSISYLFFKYTQDYNIRHLVLILGYPLLILLSSLLSKLVVSSQNETKTQQARNGV